MSPYFKIPDECSWSMKIPDRRFREVSNELAAVTPVGVRSVLILTITNCHEGHVCWRTKNNEVQQAKEWREKKNQAEVAYCSGFVHDSSSERRRRLSFSLLITTA